MSDGIRVCRLWHRVDARALNIVEATPVGMRWANMAKGKASGTTLLEDSSGFCALVTSTTLAVEYRGQSDNRVSVRAVQERGGGARRAQGPPAGALACWVAAAVPGSFFPPRCLEAAILEEEVRDH